MIKSLTIFYVFLVIPFIAAFLDLSILLGFSAIYDYILLILRTGIPLLIMILVLFSPAYARHLKIDAVIILFILLFTLTISIFSLRYFSSLSVILGYRNFVFWPTIGLVIGLVLYKNRHDVELIGLYLKGSILGNVALFYLQYFDVLSMPASVLREDVWKFVGRGGAFSYIEFGFVLNAQLLLLFYLNKFTAGANNYRTIFILWMTTTLSVSAVILSGSRLGGLASLLIAFYFLLQTKLYLANFFIASVLISLIIFITSLDLRVFTLTQALTSRFELYTSAIDPSFLITFLGNGLSSFGPASIYNPALPGVNYLDSSVLSIVLQFGLIGSLVFFLIFAYFLLVLLYNRRPFMDLPGIFIILLLVFCYSLFFNTLDSWPASVVVFSFLGFFYAHSHSRP